MGPLPADVRLGIVTALPIECAAMRLVVDDTVPATVPGDRNHYRLGWVPSTDPSNPHAVAITVLPEDGTRSAATICADLLRSFPSVRCVVMAGIAGGVPAPQAPERHVRLGDVVVATDGVVDYDHVRTVEGQDQLRRALDGLSRELLRAERELQVREHSGSRPWDCFLNGSRRAVPHPFVRPADHTDVLYREGRRIRHPDPAASGHLAGRPKIHRGAIGSADRLLRHAARRDQLASRYRLRAIEMESSGIAVGAALHDVHWFVVRGVADYCDNASKNDTWHGYAALVASAYVRALLAACQPFDGGHPTGATGTRLGLDALSAIADALLGIEMLNDDHDRRLFLGLLPNEIRAAVPHNSRARLHVIGIVRTCTEFAHGRQALLRALRAALPADSLQLRNAEAVIGAHWP